MDRKRERGPDSRRDVFERLEKKPRIEQKDREDRQVEPRERANAGRERNVGPSNGQGDVRATLASAVAAPTATPVVVPLEPIDREKTCPLLLRVFLSQVRHHRLEDYDARRGLPNGELQIYTWCAL